MRIIRNLLFVTFPVLIVLIIIAELIMSKFFPVADPYERFKNKYGNLFIPSAMPSNARYTLYSDEGLPGMDSVMLHSTNNVGFRGDSLISPKPIDEKRIFIIGGSTAQCLYIDDSKTLNRILQNELQKTYPQHTLKVYAAAKSGDASDEHLAMLTHRIIHMQPDIIILFSGINDMRKTIQGYDYLHLTEQKAYSPRYVYLAATRFQLGRRLYYLFKRPGKEEIREMIPLRTNYRKLFQIQQQTPVSDSIPSVNTQPYGENLRSMAGICRANGVKLVFMPNQSTWNSAADTSMSRQHWLLTCGGVTYKEEYLSAALDTLNQQMKYISNEQLMNLFDLPSVMPKTSRYFYDDCHFNVNGAAEAGKKLATYLTETNLLADSVSTFEYK